MHNIITVFLKDVRQELRSKAAINSILLFSIVSLTAVSFSIGGFTLNSDILAALLWIIILFSALSGFAHIFLKEEEERTADTLKLLAAPNDIFLGKFVFNTTLLFLLVIITVPLFLAVFNFEIKNTGLFLETLVLGNLGLSAGGTVVSAIIAKASSRGALFSVLAFPVLLPVIIICIGSTRIAFKDVTSPLFSPEIQALFAYVVVIITASVLLFEHIWND